MAAARPARTSSHSIREGSYVPWVALFEPEAGPALAMPPRFRIVKSNQARCPGAWLNPSSRWRYRHEHPDDGGANPADLLSLPCARMTPWIWLGVGFGISLAVVWAAYSIGWLVAHIGRVDRDLQRISRGHVPSE